MKRTICSGTAARFLAVSVVFASSLAACGTASGPAGGGVSTPPTVTASAASPGGEARGRPGTLTGTVSDGVEAGCVILTTNDGVYQLLGPEAGSLPRGVRVQVDGAPDDTLLTTCQQGLPFLVSAVRRAA